MEERTGIQRWDRGFAITSTVLHILITVEFLVVVIASHFMAAQMEPLPFEQPPTARDMVNAVNDRYTIGLGSFLVIAIAALASNRAVIKERYWGYLVAGTLLLLHLALAFALPVYEVLLVAPFSLYFLLRLVGFVGSRPE